MLALAQTANYVDAKWSHSIDSGPLLTFLSHIWRGLLPMLYKMDKNPLWNVFLNIVFGLNRQSCAHTVYRLYFRFPDATGSVYKELRSTEIYRFVIRLYWQYYYSKIYSRISLRYAKIRAVVSILFIYSILLLWCCWGNQSCLVVFHSDSWMSTQPGGHGNGTPE